MTRRGKIICLGVSGILALLIEMVTAKIINYNLFLVFISAFFYFSNFVFLTVNLYCVITKEFAEYHFHAAVRNVTVLAIQFVLYCVLGNLFVIKFLHLFIAILIEVVLIFVARKISKTMEKICPFEYSE